MRLSHSTQKAFKILYFCFFKCFFFSCMFHPCCSFNSVHSTLPFPHSPILPRSRRDNHQIWPNKIKIKLGTNHYIKSPNRRKRFPSREKRVRDTPTPIPGGPTRTPSSTTIKVYVEDLVQTHTMSWFVVSVSLRLLSIS